MLLCTHCNTASATQRWVLDKSFAGSICDEATSKLCFNVQVLLLCQKC